MTQTYLFDRLESSLERLATLVAILADIAEAGAAALRATHLLVAVPSGGKSNSPLRTSHFEL